MSDPVAEAAAQLAEQAEQTQEVAEPGNAPAVVEASVTAPATAEEAGTATVGESLQSSPASTMSTMPEPSTDDLPNNATPADLAALGIVTNGPESEAAARQWLKDKGYSPNVASGAAEPTTEPDSAPSADGANTTSPTDASSAEPLHVRVAAHLEAIFQMVKTDTQRAPTEAESHAEHVKTHIGDVLHRISNGMAVAEGEMVQKLEALYRML